jgi:DNA-binding response OmpR family regulator
MSKKVLLVVDDEENIRLLYKEELSEEGYDVMLAESGSEAIKIVKENNVDLVILDIKMPKIDGIETLRQIKEEKRDLPVVLCSAYGEYKQDFCTWASDAYIVKSANLAELKSIVRNIIDKKENEN